ncbi:MAG: cytochrome c oxidase assembly protein, partial [Alphaproteobacteria bacterium]|nr:cytochrome c oxidase assembly protein [Alphaproteobacteria bacterium]
MDRNKIVALSCAASVAGMVAQSFSAVTLYKLYCQVTGYGGTTQRAEQASDVVLDRMITVRFDANVDPDLPWDFRPVVNTMKVKIGESALAFYRATNLSDKAIKGTAGFNVSPDTAGVHFNKIECFCFTEQELAAGETVEMPLTFFVDPAIVNDVDAGHLSTITLSYRFYPSGDDGEKP